MRHSFPFTFANIEKEYDTILKLGYHIVTCAEYVILKKDKQIGGKTLINRVDIDVSCKKANILGRIFDRLGIKGTFFIRLHAQEYNPFSFENYRCLKYLRDSGHEIGYHSEIIDESTIWDEEGEICLRRDIHILGKMLDIQIKGTASHGGATGLNNLDFWKVHKPAEFGLLYEAYDHEADFNLFNESFYISDSCWTYWKCYAKGQEQIGDRRSPGEHAQDGHPLIYLLIHPDTYYQEHFYE